MPTPIPMPASARRNAVSLLTLWDSAACVPLALIVTTGFNNHRSAAGFAAAAQVLAPPDAGTLAVFGAGKIAPAAIRYLASVRPFRHVLIVGRGRERAPALALSARQWPDFDAIKVEAEPDPARAAALADVILTITTADAPVFPGAAVKPGALVILGGANRAHAREADDALIARARVFADHLDGCLERAGDLRDSARLRRAQARAHRRRDRRAARRPRRRLCSPASGEGGRAPTSRCSNRSGSPPRTCCLPRPC